MNCSKLLVPLFFGILISASVKALELEELWEVTLPEGQNYLRTGIAWSPSDNMPHVFMMGRSDNTIYHMTPGQEFEPLLTLPDYPLGGIVCFGVCLDTTWESSVLVHFRFLNPDYGRMLFVNLHTGDSLFASLQSTRMHIHIPGYQLNYWWDPNIMFCSGARNGMVAYISGPYHIDEFMFNPNGSYSQANNGNRLIGWNTLTFDTSCSYRPVRSSSIVYCLMGADSLPDFVFSGRNWGYHNDSQWNYRATEVYHCPQQTEVNRLADAEGKLTAFECADGPATGFFLFCNDLISYYRQGPICEWVISSEIPNPMCASVFRCGAIPQHVALIYSTTDTLFEVDLMNGSIGETVCFPEDVQAMQPYPVEGDTQEFMAIFSNRVCGYRISDFMPIEEDDSPLLPEIYSLTAYPNPFNDAVTITYELPRMHRVQLRIFGITGREVVVLENNSRVAGKHEVQWNAGDVSSGIYFAYLETENATRVHKLVYLK